MEFTSAARGETSPDQLQHARTEEETADRDENMRPGFVLCASIRHAGVLRARTRVALASKKKRQLRQRSMSCAAPAPALSPDALRELIGSDNGHSQTPPVGHSDTWEAV